MSGDLSAIRLLVTDVDGCLTDGTVTVDSLGREACRYSKRDGVLLLAMREAGIAVVALTSEQTSGPHEARAKKLGIPLETTTPERKLASLRLLAIHFARNPNGTTSDDLSHVAYLGDDLPDLPCLEAVGAAFVPDGAPVLDHGVRAGWHVVSPGGDGALRDACACLLTARGYDCSRWPVRKAAG